MRAKSFLFVLFAFLTTFALPESSDGVMHPRMGRFLQRDPVGYPEGMHSYAAYHVMHGGVDPEGTDSKMVQTRMSLGGGGGSGYGASPRTGRATHGLHSRVSPGRAESGTAAPPRSGMGPQGEQTFVRSGIPTDPHATMAGPQLQSASGSLSVAQGEGQGLGQLGSFLSHGFSSALDYRVGPVSAPAPAAQPTPSSYLIADPATVRLESMLNKVGMDGGT